MEKYIKVNKRKFNSRKTPQQQPLRFKKTQLVCILGGAIVLFLFILAGTHQGPTQKKSLRDQVIYTSHNRTCTATLCNPLNRCSTWSANQVYDWSTLSQAGLFRDLATAQVSVGCELRIKVEDRVRGGEWLSLSDGFTECSEYGYGRKCRNLVEIDLKANALILAQQLKRVMTAEQHSQEIVLTQQGIAPNKMDCTLVSQFSVNQLPVFAKVINEWEGPISIAIYFTHPSDIDLLVDYLQDPHHLALYSRVTLSLVKPNFLSSAAYPINHLRNIAITESTTDYVFVIDADMMPSPHLYNHIYANLLPLLARRDLHTAWVVPSMHENHAQPWSRALAYEVCYESQWEPYYIVHREAPLYDSRFRDQGGDRQSHALHLNAERYRFMVLREGFMIHSDHSEGITQKEQSRWGYFKDYEDEIESLYGKWARWPRGCSASAIGWQDQRRNTLGLAIGAI